MKNKAPKIKNTSGNRKFKHRYTGPDYSKKLSYGEKQRRRRRLFLIIFLLGFIVFFITGYIIMSVLLDISHMPPGNLLLQHQAFLNLTVH